MKKIKLIEMSIMIILMSGMILPLSHKENNNIILTPTQAQTFSFVSKSNNLTKEVYDSSGIPEGYAEKGQYILFSATFNAPVDEAWFENNFTSTFYENLTDNIQINGNTVTYLYYCSVEVLGRYYRIWARSGSEYAVSTPSKLRVLVAEPPQKVTDLSATSSKDHVELNWIEPYDNVKVYYYRIYRGVNVTLTPDNFESYYYASTNQTGYADYGAKEGTTYSYYVQSVDGAGLKSAFDYNYVVDITPDYTPPSIISPVKFTGVAGGTVTIEIKTQADCKSVKLIIIKPGVLEYPEIEMKRVALTVTTSTWRVTINVDNFQSYKLETGSYDLKFILTDETGNTNDPNDPSYYFSDALTINPPGPPTSLIITIAVIAAVGIGAGIGVFIYMKKKKERSERTATPAPVRRKRQIYSGASQIGKLSGKLSEAMLAQRKMRKIGESAPISAPSPPSSAVSESKLKKLPTSLQIKLAESKVDAAKRLQFLEPKIDAIDSQLAILTTIISSLHTESDCPICGNRVSSLWEICPYCKVKELGPVKTPPPIGNKRRCGTCGEILEPDWITCPYCKTKGVD